MKPSDCFSQPDWSKEGQGIWEDFVAFVQTLLASCAHTFLLMNAEFSLSLHLSFSQPRCSRRQVGCSKDSSSSIWSEQAREEAGLPCNLIKVPNRIKLLDGHH